MAAIRIASPTVRKLLGLTRLSKDPETDRFVGRTLGIARLHASEQQTSLSEAVREMCRLNSYQSDHSVSTILDHVLRRHQALARIGRPRAEFNAHTRIVRGGASTAQPLPEQLSLDLEPRSGFRHELFEGVLLRADIGHDAHDERAAHNGHATAPLREHFGVAHTAIPFQDKLVMLEKLLDDAGMTGTVYTSISAQYSDREPPFFVIDLPDQDTQIVSSTQRGATTLIIKGRKPIAALTRDLDAHTLKLEHNVRFINLRDVESWKAQVLDFVNKPLSELPEQAKSRFRWHGNPDAADTLMRAFEFYKTTNGKRPVNNSGLLIDPLTRDALCTWEGAYQALRRGEIAGLESVRSLGVLEKFIDARNADAQLDRAEHNYP
jgi:hypothetical protein